MHFARRKTFLLTFVAAWTKVRRLAGRIWSPPSLQGLCLEWQGQDCCRISGLFMEEFTLPGLNDLRAYRPYRDHGLFGPSSRPGFQYAGLTCLAITVDNAFAIRGGSSPFFRLPRLTTFPFIVSQVDSSSCASRSPNRSAPSYWPERPRLCSSRVLHEFG